MVWLVEVERTLCNSRTLFAHGGNEAGLNVGRHFRSMALPACAASVTTKLKPCHSQGLEWLVQLMRPWKRHATRYKAEADFGAG